MPRATAGTAPTAAGGPRAKSADSRKASAVDEGSVEVSREAAIPTRYSSVAHTLRDEIAAGAYPLGTNLPTEFELCNRFAVSRSTVRQALSELESAGIVKRRQGSGTTVIAREPPLRYSMSVATEADILRFASETALEFTEVCTPVSAADGRRLRLGAPNEWRAWRGLRRSATGGLPLGRATVFVPVVYADAMKSLERRAQHAIFTHIAAANGLTLSVIEQEITATVVDADEAELLQTPVGTPALSIVRRFSSDQGLIEVAETIFPAERFSYDIRLEREQPTRLSRGDRPTGR